MAVSDIPAPLAIRGPPSTRTSQSSGGSLYRSPSSDLSSFLSTNASAQYTLPPTSNESGYSSENQDSSALVSSSGSQSPLWSSLARTNDLLSSLLNQAHDYGSLNAASDRSPPSSAGYNAVGSTSGRPSKYGFKTGSPSLQSTNQPDEYTEEPSIGRGRLWH